MWEWIWYILKILMSRQKGTWKEEIGEREQFSWMVWIMDKFYGFCSHWWIYSFIFLPNALPLSLFQAIWIQNWMAVLGAFISLQKHYHSGREVLPHQELSQQPDGMGEETTAIATTTRPSQCLSDPGSQQVQQGRGESQPPWTWVRLRSLSQADWIHQRWRR